jgi:hypothetical protein
MSTGPAASPAPRADPAGRAGLAAIAVSVALTFTVAVLGPSVMEPALPGRPGQPPWAFAAAPSPYLVIALTAAAVLAGTAGLALTLRASRRGWPVSPRVLLTAGILAAVALALVPPFGSSDHLSYASYGRMVVTGHNPFTTTPAALAGLGDPVARAVQDWRASPSVYGSVATGLQALAALIGGTSARLTVFVLSLLGAAAFALTALLLHRLTRGDARRQQRAALMWTCNPLMLQVLVAGAHVDTLAIVFAVASLAVFCHYATQRATPARHGLAAAAAGALIGLGFAVKATMVLVGAGLAIACVLAWRRGAPAHKRARRSREDGAVRGGRALRELVWLLGGLATGFVLAAGGSLVYWGPSSLGPALREGSFVSIGTPWRFVRYLVHLATGEATAEDLVKIGAVILALGLLGLLLRSINAAEPGSWPDVPRLANSGGGPGPLGASTGPAASSALTGPAGAAVDPARPVLAALAVCAAFAVAFAWLVAWPYVLPWYDGLGWALLALLPWSRLDWLLLARTTALALGYLPARVAGITMPSSLGWLQSVVRTALTPAVLLAVLVTLVVLLWPRRGDPAPGQAAAGARARARL